MSSLKLFTPEIVSLKGHADITERWLQDRLEEKPELLGLGELVIRDRERPQPRAGRLDLLLEDVDSRTRYEVELQLGSVDESHIIRAIEYWDIERKRYPQYDHIAVIVAEDVTSRFLNVISLFNGSIPLIAIQLQGVRVNGAFSLISTRVIDVVQLGTEDEDEGITTDRSYWENNASRESLALMDDVLQMINKVEPDANPRYRRRYVGLEHRGQTRNYVVFRPRKSSMLNVEFKIPHCEELSSDLENKGLTLLNYKRRFGQYRLKVDQEDLKKRREEIEDLIQRARDSFLGT